LKVTKKCDLLKRDEARRQEEQVDAELTARGYHLLRQDITEKEETANGEYEVDLSRYFKLLPPDVDETIFEEE
jgi:hypothetical protein